VPVFAPGHSTEVYIPAKKIIFKEDSEYMLNVYAHEVHDLPYADSGFINSSDQFIISRPAVDFKGSSHGKTPVINETDNEVLVTTAKAVVTIDKSTGYLSGYNYRNNDFIKEPFSPNFWRAETDNDWRGWKPSVYLELWKTAPEYLSTTKASVKCSSTDNVAIVTVSKDVYNDKASLQLIYSIYPDGTVKLEYDLRIADDTPEPLRVGLQGQIDSKYDNVSYFGRGPQENYSDRNDGAFLGIWQHSVQEMMVQYVYPQENGNRTDVRWMTLTDDDGCGLKIVGCQPLNMSVWNTTQKSLHDAKHIGEMQLLSDAFVLNIDLIQAGVGGTDSWTPRARPYDKYRLLDKEYSYAFYLIPINN